MYSVNKVSIKVVKIARSCLISNWRHVIEHTIENQIDDVYTIMVIRSHFKNNFHMNTFCSWFDHVEIRMFGDIAFIVSVTDMVNNPTKIQIIDDINSQ